MKAGWHEVRESDPAAGGVLLAALASQQYDHVLWVQSPHAQVDIFNVLGWAPEYLFFAERIDQLFMMLTELHEVADLVVIDNLAEFAPVHPQNVQIAHDVRRYWFAPKCPVLVLNQAREPYAPGGDFWRSRLQSKQTLSNVLAYPDLFSQLCPDGRWLVWERSKCIRCGCQVLDSIPLRCPECNLVPWTSRKPYFGDWDYQEKEQIPCHEQARDWPFLKKEVNNA